MTKSSTVKELLKTARQMLAGVGDIHSGLEAEILLGFVLNKNRSWLFAWPEQQVSQSQSHHFEHCLQQRLQGMPISHITGKREFWGLELDVSPATLIPRPETELLVETAISQFDETAIKVLDMGTGSGAIAIALAHERPQWQITASDFSEQALQIAARNCQKFAPHIRLVNSHWFDNIPDGPFQLIISNPPYIEADDPHLQQADLRHEPLSALASGDDGLKDLRHICSHASDFLDDNGRLMLEHGYNQGVAVAGLLADAGFTEIETLCDLAGHQRISIGRKKPLE